MKYLIIAALLIGCAKEQPKKDLIIFTAKSEYGNATVKKDGVVIDDREIRGQYRFEVEAKPGEYELFYVSVPPGYATAYIHHNETRVAMFEQPNGSRINATLKYSHK